MNFVMLINMPFMAPLRRWLAQWQGRTLSAPRLVPDTPPDTPPTAPITPSCATTNASAAPHIGVPANTHITPQQWLAQQPPGHPCFIYIDRETRAMMELLSVPSEQVKRLFNCPSYRDLADWFTITPQRLRRIGSVPSVDQQLDLLEELQNLHTARCYNSTEMQQLDVRILSLWEQVRDSPNDAETLPQLADLLSERQRASKELAQLDQAFLPLLQKLGIGHV